MTHRFAGSGRGVPRLWLLPIGVLLGILGATGVGILSWSLMLDLVAWWPVWLAVVLIGLLGLGRRVGRVRVAGLVPLLATVALLVFLAGHLAGWPVMPSSSPRLIGPTAQGTTTATLTARIDGTVRVVGGADFLYEVDPVRLGGEIGVPDAVEEVEESAISVLLLAPSEPGSYEFAGWDIVLSSTPTWHLTLGGEIDADLGGLQITGLVLSGVGVVRLGRAVIQIPASIVGVFELIVPKGVAARVVGMAVVPETWEQLPDGWRSSTPGDGWVISVPEGSSLSVTER